MVMFTYALMMRTFSWPEIEDNVTDMHVHSSLNRQFLGGDNIHISSGKIRKAYVFIIYCLEFLQVLSKQ